jgi:membrane-associated protease RseP (regulator of RpoE activity)
MFAFPAAKRALFFVLSAILILSVPLAMAGDKSGYLGVMLQDVSPSMAKALQLGDETGILINEVVADSPAAKAGLEDGDVIVAFEGKPLGDYADLSQAVGAHKPGTTVTVTVLRDGKKQDVAVELGERENDFAWHMVGDGDHDVVGLHEMMKDGHHAWTFEHDEDFVFPEGRHGDVFVKKFGDGEDVDVYFVGADRGYLGVHLDDLSGQLGEYFGVEDGQGVLITEVVADSPAAAAGLQAGDVIVKVDDVEVADSGDLHAFMRETEKDQTVAIGYLRKGKFMKSEITLAEAPETEFSDQIRIMTDRAHNMHFEGPKKLKVRRVPSPDRHVEIIREMHGAESGLDEMREELEKMRQELEAMKKELKK